jgi:hypothetical protein
VVVDVADGGGDLVSTKLEIIDTSLANLIPPASIVNENDVSGVSTHVTSLSSDVSGAMTSSSNSVLGASTAVTQALETLLKTNECPPPTASFFHRLTCVECGIHVHLG